MRRVVVQAGDDAVLLAGGNDTAQRVDHRRFFLIQARPVTQCQAQVRRADVDRVDAGHLQDGVEVFERLGGFDHRHHQHIVVGVIAVIRPGVDGGAHRPPASVALRRVLAGFHHRLGLRGGADHRADDAVDAGVEDFHQQRRIVPGDARQGDGAGGGHRLQHGDGGLVIDDAVLHVDGQRIEPLVGHDLGRESAGDRQPAVDDGVAARPDRFQCVFAHRFGSPSSQQAWIRAVCVRLSGHGGTDIPVCPRRAVPPSAQAESLRHPAKSSLPGYRVAV